MIQRTAKSRLPLMVADHRILDLWIVFACPYRFNKEPTLITTVPGNEWPN